LCQEKEEVRPAQSATLETRNLDWTAGGTHNLEHGITRPGEDGVEGEHVVGDDIAEAAERKMTDIAKRKRKFGQLSQRLWRLET
jgi:hypothetical protein